MAESLPIRPADLLAWQDGGGDSDRAHADSGFTGRAILNEVPFRLDATLNCGGLSAYQMLVGSNPAYLLAYLLAWQHGGGDADFAQNNFASNQFKYRWKLRVRAQGTMLKGTATSK